MTNNFTKKIILFLSLFLLTYTVSIAQTTTLYLTTAGGDFQTEKWVEITTGIDGTGTVIWAQGNGTYGDSQGLVTDQAFTVDDGKTYYVNCYDRYDDTWDGTMYTIRTATGGGGTLIANNGGVTPSDGNDQDATGSWEDKNTERESSEAFFVSLSNPSPCQLNAVIPDNNCDSSNEWKIDVTTAAGTQLGTDVLLSSVKLIIEHTYDADLDIQLTSPNGVVVVLTTDNGGSGNNFGDPLDGSCASVTNFTMSAATNITAGSAPFIGDYIPQGNFTSFHDNSSPIGLWTLQICDDAGSDTGELEYVELVFVPTNDECVDAKTLTVQVGATCAAQTNGTTVGATDSGVSPGCAGASFKDVWYTLTVPPTGKVTIETSSNGGLLDSGMAVWAACGGALIGCNDDINGGANRYSRIIIDDAANGTAYANTTVYISVWEYQSDNPGTFAICASTPAAANDDSAGAITLMQNASCINTASTSYAASQTLAANTCSGFTGTADDDVWFKFIATTPNPIIQATSATDLVVELFESDATTLVTCIDGGNPETINATGLMAGDTYYVRVFTYSSGNYADFDICVFGAPTAGSNPVASGTLNSCKSVNTILSTGAGLWLNIYDGTDIVAAIKDDENLGNITTSIFVNGTGLLRQDGTGISYLDRNIAINPAIQPGGNIDVRLFIKQTEFDALAAVDGDITTISDLALTKVAGVCTASFGGIGTLVLQTGSGNWGSDYYIDITISSFSNFFFQNPNAALPLDLISFRANEKNTANELIWITENELDVKQFEVQRSINGFRDFETLATVLSHSNGSIRSNYSYLDTKPAIKSYYRLKMIDVDGAFSYSTVVEITKESTELTVLQMFPNPTSKLLNVAIGGLQNESVVIKIIDTYGKVVYQQITHNGQRGSHQFSLDVSTYAKGYYTLLLIGDNERLTKAFIVQ